MKRRVTKILLILSLIAFFSFSNVQTLRADNGGIDDFIGVPLDECLIFWMSKIPLFGILFGAAICPVTSAMTYYTPECVAYYGLELDLKELEAQATDAEGNIDAEKFLQLLKEATGKCTTDTDGDGSPDYLDNCLNTKNPHQLDTDGDGVGNMCDPYPCANEGIINPETETCIFSNPSASDADGDGIEDGEDNCTDISNADQTDSDTDGIGNACDNCTDIANTDQTNSDGDKFGDVCDNCKKYANDKQTPEEATNCTKDDDGDGIPNIADNCPTVWDTNNACPAGDINGGGGSGGATLIKRGNGGGGCTIATTASVNVSLFFMILLGAGLIIYRRRT